MLLSPLVTLAVRCAPPKLSFRIQLARLARWKNTEWEWLQLDEFVDRRRAAIDVGARHGIYAGRLAQLCDRVHCVEPQPTRVADLRRVMPRNVVVHPVALSDRSGTAELRVPLGEDGRASLEPNNGVVGETFVVPVRRLDDLVTEPVGFIKIDVEGHELSVLSGAERILREHRPVLLVESERTHHPAAPQHVFRFLEDRGYRGWFHWHGARLPIDEFDLESHQPAGDQLAYVNNFIFEPLAADGTRPAAQ